MHNARDSCKVFLSETRRVGQFLPLVRFDGIKKRRRKLLAKKIWREKEPVTNTVL